MGITVGVLTNKANQLKDLVYLGVYIILIGDTVDNKALCNNVTNRHTGIERCNRILEDHLDLSDKLALACHATLGCQLTLKCLYLIGIGLGCDLLCILCVKCGNK